MPPGYRRSAPVRRPKLDGFTEIIEQWLRENLGQRAKQRHTAKRVFERLRDEHGFVGGYTIVKDYIREHRRRGREMFVPLHHPPGHAQADFGEARVVIPAAINHDTCAQARLETEVTRAGSATKSFQAWQQASTMAR